MGRLIGEELRKDPFPIIEITGQVDTGKKHIAKLLASRIGGMHVYFPNLSFNSSTGKLLMQYFSKDTKFLENNPEWWAHIYMANIYECKLLLESARHKFPLVITNYLTGFRIWGSSLGFNTRGGFKSFSTGLPQPNIVYSIIGPKFQEPGSIKLNLSLTTQSRIDRGMLFATDNRIIKVNMSDYNCKFRHININDACDTITKDIQNRYKVNVSNKYYDMDMFLLKKDL